MDLNKLTQAVLTIAQEAGEKIMEVYNSADFSVERKDDNSPLTAADLASHHHIVAALQALTPEYPVLSEENASELSFEERSQWQTYWLVDPLDGTKEFIKRNDEFSILIALVQDNTPIIGVVHAPVLKTSWFASKGNGAFKQSADEVAPIAVRTSTTPLAVVGSRSHASAGLQAFLGKIGEYELVSMGSILKACMVAEGTADIYPRIGLTSEWDTAAAQIIVEEAGGHFTRTDMQPMRYNTKESLLNPHFFVFGKDYRDWSQYLSADS